MSYIVAILYLYCSHNSDNSIIHIVISYVFMISYCVTFY